MQTPEPITYETYGIDYPNTAFSLPLFQGWNMIGDPYNATVPMSNMTITPITGGSPMNLSEADANGYVYYQIYSYDPATNQYVAHSTDSLTPFTGYWLKAFQPCKLTIAQ